MSQGDVTGGHPLCHWYLRVSGHYNMFRYGSDLVSGRMTDWTAYAALGFRF